MTAEPRPAQEGVYTGVFSPGWILFADLAREPANLLAADETAAQWVAAVLDAAGIPRERCLWMAWNPSRIQLPTSWDPGEPGPLAGQWRNARLFHERMEIRLERTRHRLAFRLLTEDLSLKEAAEHAIPPLRDSSLPGSPDRVAQFRTLPGEVVLAGLPVSLGAGVPPGARAEVRYPRLLVYRTAGGPVSAGPDGRARASVTRYFDELYRLRAIRYRGLKS